MPHSLNLSPDRERIDRRLGQIGRFLAQAGDALPPMQTDPHARVAVETVAQIRHALAYLYVVVQLQETRLRALEDAPLVADAAGATEEPQRDRPPGPTTGIPVGKRPKEWA